MWALCSRVCAVPPCALLSSEYRWDPGHYVVSWAVGTLGRRKGLLWRWSFHLLLYLLPFSIVSIYYFFNYKEKEPPYLDKVKPG